MLLFNHCRHFPRADVLSVGSLQRLLPQTQDRHQVLFSTTFICYLRVLNFKKKKKKILNIQHVVPMFDWNRRLVTTLFGSLVM